MLYEHFPLIFKKKEHRENNRSIGYYLGMLSLLTVLLFSSSCTAKLTKGISTESSQLTVTRFIESDSIFSSQFTGVSLYSITEDKWLTSYNATKLFTPASNTKILTLHAALKLLPDSVVTFYSYKKAGTLYIVPNGDPSLLHPDFSQNTALKQLQKWNGPITIVASPEKENRYFGSGWAWDDYPDYYQAEITRLPLYGNSLHINNGPEGTEIIPAIFKDAITYLKADERADFSRELRENKFFISQRRMRKPKIVIPFVTSPDLNYQLLSDTLGKAISGISTKIDSQSLSPLYGISTDTLLKKMMFESDNFIAEQLILMIGNKLNLSKTKDILQAVKDSIFQFSEDQIHWIDGSGLSRYNLSTPHFITELLKDIYRNIGLEGIKTYFASGGEHGDRKHHYMALSPTPYMYAKTGTLRNNHSLSGYLITDRGNLLAFSIMNNHYYGGSSSVKPSMKRLLTFFRERY